MGDQAEPDGIEQRSVIRIKDEADCRHGQNPANRPARRLEHDQDRQRPAHQVDRIRFGRAVNELAEIDERPGQPHNGEGDERPVEHRHAAAIPFDGRKQEEGQHQGDEQKAHTIDLRLNDADDPVQGVHRKTDRKDRGEDARSTRELASRRFGFERLDQLIRVRGHACCSV